MNSHSRHSVKQAFCRVLFAGAISSVGIFSGIVPNLSTNTTALFDSAAYAQAVSDPEVVNFANIVWEFEPIRRKLMAEIQQIVGSKDIKDIYCEAPNSYQSLPAEAKKRASELCNRFDEIKKQHNMPASRFAQIAGLVQGKPPTDPLRQRVDKKLIEIQQKKPNR